MLDAAIFYIRLLPDYRHFSTILYGFGAPFKEVVCFFLVLADFWNNNFVFLLLPNNIDMSK